MPAQLSFKFSLNKHIGVLPPSAAIYVDVNGDGQLSDAEQVPLTQDGLTWTGVMDLESDSSEGVEYVIWFRGTLGVGWTLQVSSNTPSDHVVSHGAGTVVSAPESFPGECTS
jgi:hypothetical protein